MNDTPGDTQPIRVLYCIMDNRFGGPHRLAETAARRLRTLGVETSFLFGQKSPELWRPEGFEAFWCRSIQCFARHHPLLNFVRFCCMLPYNAAKIRKLIRSKDITLVHVDGVTNFVPALAARWAGVPIVWLYNDHLPGPLQRLLLPMVTRLASRVIVQGEGLRQSRTAGNPRLRDKTSVIYSGIDADSLVREAYDAAERARLRAELGVPADCVLIGAIGNLNRFKGYPYFLQAAAKIRQRVSHARFVIVGRKLDTDAACWEQVQQLRAELGLEDSVFLAGFREDIPRVLSALDVFVLPSILESCPVALLEAMAMKVPVVATDVGAVREMVDSGRTGFVVPAGDGGAMAEAVLMILAKPRDQVEKMVEQARKTVEQKFAIDTIARQQKEVYELCRLSW
ncbi:MAG TPA: glycosyltransferase [Sedimentisphaerales bacterium]|jgi:glycosyltransferase involved in cell wall biosynthesis|nr:glycosyltransferase [Sedimentisphaerales bacterium]HNU29078.1 glycosyltransferase [Sedimentisphaerales bacterium]